MNPTEKLIDHLIVQGISAFHQGNRTQAVELLCRALAVEPRHERLWWMLSRVVDNPAAQLVCLDNVLALNPENRRAAVGRAALRPDLDGIALDPTAEVPEADPRRFITGGTVNRRKGIYVTREADRALYERCITGGFSYVLTARQRGKSSLMMRTSERLRESGIRTARVDLNRIGGDLQSIDSLYVSILTEIVRDLKLPLNVAAWWRDENHSLFSPAKRFEAFIHDELLKALTEPLIIFIDEIDAIRKIKRNFNVDDFFALIRSLHNASAEDEVYQRLTFVLLGVARPEDLISDPARTPFNIGANIEVADFTLSEAGVMMPFLGLPLPYAEQVLVWVLEWTGGHPNLTQKICQRIAEQAPHNRAEIADLVHKLFIVPPDPDNNLKFVSSMLTPEGFGSEVLEMYYRIYTGRTVYEDDEDAATVEQLKLSGIVEVVPYHIGRRRERGLLVIRNRIYETFFDLGWIRDTFQQRYNTALNLLEIGLRRDADSQIDSALPEPLAVKPLDQLASPGIKETTTTAAAAQEDKTRPVPETVSLDDRLRRTGTPFDLSEFHPMFQSRNAAINPEPPTKDVSERADAMVREAAQRVFSGYTEQGRSLLVKALQLDATNALGWLSLARITDNKDEKIAYLQKVIELEPPLEGRGYTGSAGNAAQRLLDDLTGKKEEKPQSVNLPVALKPLPKKTFADDPFADDDLFEESPFEAASKQSQVAQEDLFADDDFFSFDDAPAEKDEFDFSDAFADEDDRFAFDSLDGDDGLEFADDNPPPPRAPRKSPRYEMKARRWFYEARTLYNRGKIQSAQDFVRLYLWFARGEAQEASLKLLDIQSDVPLARLSLYRRNVLLREAIYDKPLSEILRKPWQVGAAYRTIDRAKRALALKQPGRAKRLIYAAVQDFPAIADDSSVEKLIGALKDPHSLRDRLDNWRTADVKADAPDAAVFQLRKWVSLLLNVRFGSRIRVLILLVCVIIVVTFIAGVLVQNLSTVAAGITVVSLVLFAATMQIERIIPRIPLWIFQGGKALVDPVFDIVRCRTYTYRMIAAYWLAPQRWISIHGRDVLVFSAMTVIALAAYAVLFQVLLALGLSAGAILAGTASLLPIYLMLGLVNE